MLSEASDRGRAKRGDSVGAGRAAAEHRQRDERHPWPPRWLRWVPPALVVATMVLDQVTPPRYFFGALLTASVVLALFTYPPLGVLAVGAAGCVLLAVTETLEDYVGPMTIAALTVLATITVLSTSLCVVRQRIESRFRRVQAVAEAVQLALLRPLPARIGPLRLAGFYRAADDEALIGGDLYSVRPTPFGIRVIVGDVKGKGISATQTVATVISSFQEAALLQPSLDQVAERIDVALQLDRDNPPAEPMGGRPARVRPREGTGAGGRGLRHGRPARILRGRAHRAHPGPGPSAPAHRPARHGVRRGDGPQPAAGHGRPADRSPTHRDAPPGPRRHPPRLLRRGHRGT